MKRSVFAALAAALLAGPAVAQTAAIDAEVKRKLDATRQAERTEDVEVLRRILNAALGIQNQSEIKNHPYAAAGADVILVQTPAVVAPFDGVYLPGHGVVYTLKVPAAAGVALDPAMHTFGLLETCLKCHTALPKDAVNPHGPAAVKPPTEWERTRADLLGVKPSVVPVAVKPSPICEPGSLTESLVAKLRANARNVRHLSPNEHVTVVVTFDGYTGSAANRVTRSGTAAQLTTPPGFTPEEAQLLSLGDLHLKQGKSAEAAAAYEKGLARFNAAALKGVEQFNLAAVKISPPPTLGGAARAQLAEETQKGIRDVYRHLARAWLAVGDTVKGQAALDLARTLTVEVVPVGGQPVTGVPVPAKLILGVSKADVDKAGDDEATFKKAVTVEVVGFPAADKPLPPAKSK